MSSINSVSKFSSINGSIQFNQCWSGTLTETNIADGKLQFGMGAMLVFLAFCGHIATYQQKIPTGPRVCHWKTGTTSLFCLSKNANPRFDTQSCLNLLDINAIPTAYFQKVVQTFHHISTKTSLLAQRVYQVVQLMLTPGKGRFDDVPFRDNFQVSFRRYNHVYPDDSPVLC